MHQRGINLSFPALRMFDNPLKPEPHWLKMIITSKEEKTMVMAVNLMMVLMKLPWQWWRNQCHDKSYLHWGELKFTARWHLEHRQRYRCSDNDASPSACHWGDLPENKCFPSTYCLTNMLMIPGKEGSFCQKSHLEICWFSLDFLNQPFYYYCLSFPQIITILKIFKYVFQSHLSPRKQFEEEELFCGHFTYVCRCRRWFWQSFTYVLCIRQNMGTKNVKHTNACETDVLAISTHNILIHRISI